MSAGKTLNAGNALYSSIVRALSGDLDLPLLRALDGGADTILQPDHVSISTTEPTATWTAQQGIARDSSNWFAINTTSIRKYDLSSNLLITNSSPFTGLPAGLTHCGDGFVDGLYLYVALSNYSSGVSTVKVIAKYLLTTLVLDSYFDLVAHANLNCSGCCLNSDGTEILVTSFYDVAGSDQRNTDIYRFSKSTELFLGINTLSVPSVGIQSITYHSDNKYYLGSWDLTPDNNNLIYVYDETFTYVTKIDPSNSSTEMEGVESFDGVLYFNHLDGSPRVLDLSNVYITNAAPFGVPVQFLDNALMTDQVTIMMKITFHSLFNFNAIMDNASYDNHWESWVYGDGRLAWRVNSAGRTNTDGMVAGQEYIIAYTWDHAGNVDVKTGVDGVYGSTINTAWITPPAAGMYLAGINASNNLGDNLYKDILVFDKVLSPSELLDSYNNFDSFYVSDGGITITPDAVNSGSISIDPVIAFESSLTLEPSETNTSSVALNPAIEFNSTLELAPTEVNSSSISLDPIIDFTSSLSLNPGETNTSSIALNPTILFAGVIELNPDAVNSSSVSLDPLIQFSSSLNLSPSTVDSLSIALNPIIEYTSALIINPQEVNSASISLDPLIEFKSVINLTPETVNSLSASVNPFISIGERQIIGTVTAGFKDDEISVKYKILGITVNFKE